MQTVDSGNKNIPSHNVKIHGDINENMSIIEVSTTCNNPKLRTTQASKEWMITLWKRTVFSNWNKWSKATYSVMHTQRINEFNKDNIDWYISWKKDHIGFVFS